MRSIVIKILAVYVAFAFLMPTFNILSPSSIGLNSPHEWNGSSISQTTETSDLVPLRKITFVMNDPSSYNDEFQYLAAVPTANYYHGGIQYVSPLILSSWSDSEKWLVEDWSDYLEPDGGVSQIVMIGDIPQSQALDIKQITKSDMFPWIHGDTPEEVAARLAVSEWEHSETAVFALADAFPENQNAISGEYTYNFDNQPVQIINPSLSISSNNPITFNFTPPTLCGWMEASIDWTPGNEYFTHILTDPNGNIIDYSVRSQTYQQRFNPSLDAPIPLQFWVPKTANGEWTLTLYPQSPVTSTINFDFRLTYHSGFMHEFTVPSDASNMKIDMSWDNLATDLNLALVDPSGRFVQWAPSGSIISRPGFDSIEVPYPMEGDWTAVAAWMSSDSGPNSATLSWEINRIPVNLDAFMESASNGAVLASLLNAPLLYVSRNSFPEITQWAVDRLGVSTSFLVDPQGIQGSDLFGLLSSFSLTTNLNDYPQVTQLIRQLSGQNDVVTTIPQGNYDELFSASALAGAFHGAPVLSLCDDKNLVTTRAEETWAPYSIGPEIDIYITNRYTTRTENGWYDERIPNRYSMQESAAIFTDFLDDRGAYNDSSSQSVLIVSPTDLIKTSFDRSLQTHFSPGRIPASGAALSSVMINRGILHRFLFSTASSASDALVSMYAYTEGHPFLDNNFNYHLINQYQNSTSLLSSAGFAIRSHVGYSEVYAALASQVGLWTFSTHGTLTRFPSDPPARPKGEGLFSLRSTDAQYGFESEDVRDVNGDNLINPVAFPEEEVNHRIQTTSDLENAIDNIGSPIVIVTACLLGGTRMPSMLMEHGAVGVIASPRTVYFQPAGLVSIAITEGLVTGRSTGQSLTNALGLVSEDYTDPLPGNPRDYANQHVLFGDPNVQLHHPSDTARIVSVNPFSIELDGHKPGRGVKPIAVLGISEIVPSILNNLSIANDYYEPLNYTDFDRLLPLRRAVVMEPTSLSSFETHLVASSNLIQDFVRSGGSLVILGVDADLTWLHWNLDYVASGSGSESSFVLDTHPLLNAPNELSPSVDYHGHFDNVWANLSILATNGESPIFVAASVGIGKLALTTIQPTGMDLKEMVENAVNWYLQPSILLNSIRTNQEIIWEGDRVIITLELTDRLGYGIDGVELMAWLNTSDVTSSIVENGEGIYVISLDGDWTHSHIGSYSLRLMGAKNGYDHLMVLLNDFIYIRPLPMLLIIGIVGVVGIASAGYIYRKKKRGEPLYSKAKSHPNWKNMSRSERRRLEEEERRKREEQRKRDEEFDPAEFFGVG